MNNRGWIKIVEAVIALLIIVGALLIMIKGGYFGESESQKVYQMQVGVLRDIELNEVLRNKILEVPEVPLGWDDPGFPGEVKEAVQNRIPENVECKAYICELDKVCGADLTADLIDKDIYAQPVAIAMTKTSSEVRQLKLFCWRK